MSSYSSRRDTRRGGSGCTGYVITGIFVFILVMWLVAVLSKCSNNLDKHTTVETMSDGDFVILAKGSLGQFAKPLTNQALTAAGRTIAQQNVRAGKAPGKITAIRSGAEANQLLQLAYKESQSRSGAIQHNNNGVQRAGAGPGSSVKPATVPPQSSSQTTSQTGQSARPHNEGKDVRDAWAGSTATPPCQTSNWNPAGLSSPEPLLARQMAPEYAAYGQKAWKISNEAEKPLPAHAGSVALLEKMNKAAEAATLNKTNGAAAVLSASQAAAGAAAGFPFSNVAQYYVNAEEAYRLPPQKNDLPYYAQTKEETLVEHNTGLIVNQFPINEMREAYAGLAPDDAKAMMASDNIKNQLPAASLMTEAESRAFSAANYDLQILAAANPDIAAEILGSACPTNMPTKARVQTAQQMVARGYPIEERPAVPGRLLGAGYISNNFGLFLPPKAAPVPVSACSSTHSVSVAYMEAAKDGAGKCRS